MFDVKREELLDTLRKQYDYLSDGGTEYRKRTAEISLEVAKNVRNVEDLIKPGVVFKAATIYEPRIDHHRKEDVAKMLRVAVKKTSLINSMSDEAKDYVNEKMKRSNMVIK